MKTEKEKMQAGETYYAFDPELMKLHRDCLKWVEEYNRTYFRDYTQGGELLRKFLPNAHPSLVIQAPFWCDFGLIFTEVRMVLLIITVRFSIRPGFIWGKIY